MDYATVIYVPWYLPYTYISLEIIYLRSTVGFCFPYMFNCNTYVFI